MLHVNLTVNKNSESIRICSLLVTDVVPTSCSMDPGNISLQCTTMSCKLVIIVVRASCAMDKVSSDVLDTDVTYPSCTEDNNSSECNRMGFVVIADNYIQLIKLCRRTFK